jgi:hypothetical protein
MTVTEIPARDFTFELNTGTTETPTWVEIGGLISWSNAPTTVRANTQTWEDGGRQNAYVSSRGDSFTLTGRRQEDPDTGDRDAGQEAAEAWAKEVGVPSQKPFRITTPGGNTITFNATAEATVGGGGEDDASTWQLQITVSGVITEA